jgi:hypothetical protein
VNLENQKKLKIDSNSKSYLENPINFNTSWFLCSVSKFWVPTLFRKLMEFPTTSIFRISTDLLQLSPNPKVDWLVHSVQTRISSIHQQIPTIITPESLIGSSQLGSLRKAKKVGYDVGIEGFLRWLLNWSQNCRFIRMLNSVQNRISAARPTSKSHSSWIVDRMRACKYALENWENPLQFLC